MLLDMHILEDEQVMLRQRIQALLNPSPTGRSHQEFWGSPGRTYSYIHTYIHTYNVSPLGRLLMLTY